MKTATYTLVALLTIPVLLYGKDMLTPVCSTDSKLKAEADAFLAACHKEPLHHPLKNPKGKTPSYQAPAWGAFGAGKGPDKTMQHHPATDLKVGQNQTEVELFAAHDGVVATFRDAPKYRHYISITKPIVDSAGKELGKLVTLYGHVDLDLDEADGLMLDGKTVKAGDQISAHLYAETRGGPHLHFEIRYYRPADAGTEEFYGFRQTVPGTGKWPYGFWNPDVGYGFGHPESHGLRL